MSGKDQHIVCAACGKPVLNRKPCSLKRTLDKGSPVYCSKKCSGPANAKKSSFAERLELYVVPIPESGCHIWTGHTIYGYGYTKIGQKTTRVHKGVYEATYGPVPKGLSVLHRCDVRACCNPLHLFLGTHKENMDDMVSKNRQAKGTSVGGAKLTEDQVLIIRNTKRRTTEFTKLFGISKTTIKDIRRGRIWRHLNGEV